MAEVRAEIVKREFQNNTLVPRSAEKPDRGLVEESVEHIREILARTVTRGMDEVGRYLLKEFYDDNAELYFSFSPTKHASLRMLVERCESLDLPVRRTFLANALRMAAITRELPKDATFHQLPPTHRVELLRVKAPEKIERLASRAVDGRLTAKKLRKLVQQSERPGGVGRKRTPAVLQAMRACLRAIRDEETGRLAYRRQDISELTDEQRALGQATLETLEKRVAELRRLFG